MEIKFEWKNFQTEKPIVGRKIILNRDGGLFMGIYEGDVSERYNNSHHYCDKDFPIYSFLGCVLNTKTLKKGSKIIYPIYTPWSYKNNNYNPYDFEWDYYCENWVNNS